MELAITPRAGVLEDTLHANSLTLCGAHKLKHDLPRLIVESPEQDAKWQYAHYSDAANGDTDIPVEHQHMPARRNWPLDAPVALKVPTKTFE